MVLAGVCRFVFQRPPEIVFGRIIPGADIAIMAGIAVYVFMAKHVANKMGRDITALPKDTRHGLSMARVIYSR